MTNSDNEKNLLNQIYLDHRDIMYNVAFKILHDSQLSEDAVHNTFMVVMLHMDVIRRIGSFQDIRNYLVIAVKHSAYAIYNKRKHEVSSEEFQDYIADSKNIEVDTENRIEGERLLTIVKSMGEKYSDIFMLKYCLGLKDREIADVVQISLENVKIRLVRGKKLLREMLEKENYNDKSTV